MNKWQGVLAMAAMVALVVAVPAAAGGGDPLGEAIRSIAKKQRQDRKQIQRLHDLVANLSARPDVPGPQGEKGAPGSQGASGTANVIVRTNEAPLVLGEGGTGSVRADCKPEESVVGGGVSSDQIDMNISVSAPTTGGGDELAEEGDTATGWLVTYKNDSDIADTDSVGVYVLCASP